MFVNVSYLSNSMKDYIDEPMPFIMGVPLNVWKSIKKQRESIPSDIIIFNIDKNKMICNEKLPDLPPKAAESLYAKMLSIIDEREDIRIKYKSSSNYNKIVMILLLIVRRILG